MKKLYLFLLLLAGSTFGLNAQSFTVTFQVDMSQVQSIADTVTVAGNFQSAGGVGNDWTPGAAIMTDANNDSIYDLTVTLPSGNYEYKFINGTAWGADEGVPGACQVNGNRGVNVTANTTIPVVCFASCSPCAGAAPDTVSVTFAVDMSYKNPASTITVAGSFQSDISGTGNAGDWTPGATVLTDPDNDSIYTGTFMIAEGTYQYKFVNGTMWGQDESVPGACATNNNREITIQGPGPVVIPTVCFGTCDSACSAPLPPINVTFQVDMNNEIVNSTGLYVAGSFQNPAWVKDTLRMTDPDNDGIYAYTVNIEPNEYQYKFYNGDGGDPDGENANFLLLGCGVDNGVGGFNRLLDIKNQLTDTILPAYVYNTCNITPVSTTEPVADFMEVYPNPFSQSTMVRFGNGTHSLQLISVTGQIVRAMENIRNNQVEVKRGDLPAGIYFIKVRNEAGRELTKKVMIN